MRQEQMIHEIKALCGKLDTIPNLGYHFIYNDYNILYIPRDIEGLHRFCIPHIVNAEDYEPTLLSEIINKVNRDVKYVKVILRNNRSVSLEYDHKTEHQEHCVELILHILNTLIFAANHLTQSLASQT